MNGENLPAEFPDDPLLYPGELPDSSMLVLPDCLHILRPQKGRRLGQARVARCTDCNNGDLTETNLNYELLCHNVAPINSRVPVVAVGSNASPAVMRRKMKDEHAESTIPLVRGTINNIAVGVSAHVARGGYLPAAAAHESGSSAAVVVGWFDARQLEALDKSEPNYNRVLVSHRDYPLSLEPPALEQNGENIGHFYIYVSKHGTLIRGDALLPLIHQTEISKWLAEVVGEPWTGRTPKEAAESLAGDEHQGERDSIRDKFAELKLSRPCGIKALEDTGEPLTYRLVTSEWGEALHAGSLRCTQTAGDFDRLGESCVVVNPNEPMARQANVVVVAQWTENRPGLVARAKPDPKQPVGTVGVDQVVREALGVEIGEYVRLQPARFDSAGVIERGLEKLIARRHYVVCRVQRADLAAVEQDVALLSPLALRLLGLPEGGTISIEGSPPTADPGAAATVHVPVVSARAHPAPDEVIARRDELAGGGLESRFPSSRDALAVFPDLPWIFLDSEQRKRLGLAGNQVTAVRVRANLLDQLSAEGRETILVLAIAALGLAGTLTTIKPAIAVVLLLVVLMGLWQLQQRLKLRLGPPRHSTSKK